jgi:UDP-N-acetylglucosamine acyltransferase
VPHEIHPTAVIHPGAKVGEGVAVGPWAVIEDRVAIGRGCRIGAHASIRSGTAMGEGNEVFPFADIGDDPQHLHYHGEETRLVIGDRNRFREFVTLHRGTPEGGGETRIGNGNFFMAYSHVAHDCRIGDRVIVANAVQMGGHTIIEDEAIIGGLSAIHQFVRIGAHAMVGGASGIGLDVPPFTMASGPRAGLHGLNLVGLKRRGFTDEAVAAIKKAYRILFRGELLFQEAKDKVRAELGGVPEVARMMDFIDASTRGVMRHERSQHG